MDVFIARHYLRAVTLCGTGLERLQELRLRNLCAARGQCKEAGWVWIRLDVQWRTKAACPSSRPMLYMSCFTLALGQLDNLLSTNPEVPSFRVSRLIVMATSGFACSRCYAIRSSHQHMMTLVHADEPAVLRNAHRRRIRIYHVAYPPINLSGPRTTNLPPKSAETRAPGTMAMPTTPAT